MSEPDEKLKYKMAKADYLFEYNPESNKLIWTSPESFSDVVRPPAVWNMKSLSNLRKRMREGKEIDPLFVDIDPNSCSITHHEGRHRAKVASELDIKEIPVLIYCRNKERGYVDYSECKPCENVFEK